MEVEESRCIGDRKWYLNAWRKSCDENRRVIAFDICKYPVNKSGFNNGLFLIGNSNGQLSTANLYSRPSELDYQKLIPIYTTESFSPIYAVVPDQSTESVWIAGNNGVSLVSLSSSESEADCPSRIQAKIISNLSHSPPHPYNFQKSSIPALCISKPSKSTFISATSEGTIFHWDLNRQTLVNILHTKSAQFPSRSGITALSPIKPEGSELINPNLVAGSESGNRVSCHC